MSEERTNYLEPSGSERVWIGEIPMRAVATVFVKAKSRKEAEEKLKAKDYEDVDTNYTWAGVGRIVREDAQNSPVQSQAKNERS